jgi:predicted O-methyltransferase YrrM
MDYTPGEGDLDLLRQRSKDRNCLDLGTGEGTSARAMLDGGARRVFAAENDPEWRGKHGIADERLIEVEWSDFYVGYDLAFVDHFPPHERQRPAELLAQSGAEVIVDDAALVAQPTGFHKHGDVWHYDPEGCSL